MVKVHTNLTLDSELIKEAKERKLNISSITEKALSVALDKVEVSFDEPTNCEFCGSVGVRATEEIKGLTWIYPNEKWICSKCLVKKGEHLI